MLNHIDVMGRLVRDPELRQTQDGTAVCSFCIACDRDRKTREGERETDFLEVVTWNRTAEFTSRYFTKGQLVALSGRLQMRDWQDKDGNKRRSAEIVAHTCYFAESKRDGSSAPAYEIPNGFDVNVDDGALPF